MVWVLIRTLRRFYYTLNRVFCRKQSFVYSLFYLCGKIVNKQRIVCDRIPGSSYKHPQYRFSWRTDKNNFSIIVKYHQINTLYVPLIWGINHCILTCRCLYILVYLLMVQHSVTVVVTLSLILVPLSLLGPPERFTNST